MINQKTFYLLDQLENIPAGTGSREAKLKILKQDKEYLRDYFNAALNPYKVYKISKLPEPQPFKGDDLTISESATFEEILSYLESQKGITGLDKQLVANFIAKQPEKHQKWLKACVLKNVKLGIEIKTLNKAGYDLPVFELLLASPNPGNDMSNVKFPCYAQEKLNGVRCVYFPKFNQFLGRNGKIVPNVNLLNHIQVKYPDIEYVLDGELYWPGHDFNEIIGVTSSDDSPIPEGFGYHVFNVLTEVEWANQVCDHPYNLQRIIIDDIAANSKNVATVETRIVNSQAEVMNFFEEIVCRPCGEGVMLRGFDSKYKWKRVRLDCNTLTKIKQEDMIDGEIIDCYEGENRHQGALGGVVVRLDEGIETRVGGGFSDDLRKELWTKRKEIVGKWILIKYTQRTPDRRNLLFPIFFGFRDSK